MTDLRALTEAFAELERRADAAGANLPAAPPFPRPRRTPRLLVPVAASVAVVAGVTAAAVLFTPGGNQSTQAGAPPTGATNEPATSGPATQRNPVPSTPEELANRFRAVLGDTATFTVTDTGHAVSGSVPSSQPGGSVVGTATSEPPPQPNGAAIVGTLTAGGVSGGFDMQIYRAAPGEQAWCASDAGAACNITTLPDGSSLATAQMPLEGAAHSVTYEVNRTTPDGVVYLMHVSNQRSPKGASPRMAAQPPLTLAQVVAIVSSDRW